MANVKAHLKEGSFINSIKDEYYQGTHDRRRTIRQKHLKFVPQKWKISVKEYFNAINDSVLPEDLCFWYLVTASNVNFFSKFDSPRMFQKRHEISLFLK